MAVLLRVTFSVSIFIGSIQADLFFGEKPVNWSTAKSACELRGGTLLGRYLFNQNDELLPIWLDAVVKWTPWIANTGCYRLYEEFKFTKNITIDTIDSMTCLQQCGNTAPIALFNHSCFCLSSTTDLRKVSGSFCKFNCTGNINDQCGGTGTLGFYKYITIFDTVDGSNVHIDSTHACLSVSRRGNVYTYYDRNCNDRLPIFCQDSKRNIIERQDRSWFDARLFCKEHNLELTDSESIAQNGLKEEDIKYWTGYFRRSTVLWDYSSYSINGDDCYILIKHSRVHNYQIEKCNETHNYVCMKPDEIMSTTITAVTKQLLPHTTATDTRKVDNAIVIGVSVGGILVLILVAVFIVVICIQKRRKQNAGNPRVLQKTSSTETDEHNQEREGLVQSESLYSKPNKSPTSENDKLENSESVEDHEKDERDSDTYDHLKLNGQRVSFKTDGGNTYDVAGLDIDEMSHIDKGDTRKNQPIEYNDTYDHTVNVSLDYRKENDT